ncbi:MAG: tetratricopeptide repeat protein [bacterium]
MNIDSEEILWRLKNEPEWVVLGLLVIGLSVGGGVYYYNQMAGANAKARQQFSAVFSKYNRIGASGKYKNVIKQFKSLHRKYKDTDLADRILFFLGKSHYKAGNYLTAQKQFQRLVDNHPESFFYEPALLHLGYSALSREKYNSARDYFRKIIDESPDHSLVYEAYWQLALLKLKKGNNSGARKTLDRLISKSKQEEKNYWLKQARSLKATMDA